MKDEVIASAHKQGSPVSLSFWKSRLPGRSRADNSPFVLQQVQGAHHIELNLREIDQLFNTMDPSPFHEKDLDHDAEEFIVSWAREFPRYEPVDLIIYLGKSPDGHNVQKLVEDAVHNYFRYRARLNQLEFKRLMKQGWTSLLVGVSFLGLCLLAIELVALHRTGALLNLLTQSLTIAGWVAMWRPMEIYLYDWWPLRRRGHIYTKLSQMPVEVRKRA